LLPKPARENEPELEPDGREAFASVTPNATLSVLLPFKTRM
jgi:hypothetical protein